MSGGRIRELARGDGRPLQTLMAGAKRWASGDGNIRSPDGAARSVRAIYKYTELDNTIIAASFAV